MSEPNAATAIDILLDPDATMIEHAKAVNARLLKVFPKGFALDASHAPHITTLMRYVRTADLDKVYAAASRIFSRSKVTRMKVKAFKYYFLTDKSIPGLGGAGIVVGLNPELMKVQQDLIDAVAPYTVETGTPAAFATTPEEPDVDVLLQRAESAGAQYRPALRKLSLSPTESNWVPSWSCILTACRSSGAPQRPPCYSPTRRFRRSPCDRLSTPVIRCSSRPRGHAPKRTHLDDPVTCAGATRRPRERRIEIRHIN